MQTKDFRFTIYQYASIEELNEQDRLLIKEARKAAEKAYSPYSKFNVGAAVLLENGEVIVGNNQENSAFPSGLCAERVALFYANSAYPEVPVRAIAITGHNEHKALEKTIKPCGACRQVMVETEERFGMPIKVILDGGSRLKSLKMYTIFYR